jgi:hypothetical protein
MNGTFTDEEDRPMKTLGVFVASALFAVLTAAPVYAQQPGPAPGAAQPRADVPAAPPGAPGPGMMSGAMPMMDMCRQMMGGMGMPMMGGAPPADPKERAAMMEMRGEMMKAMGDIMVKHGRRMQGMTGN